MVGCAAHFLRRLFVSVRGPERAVAAFTHGERQQWGAPPVPCRRRGCVVHTYERTTPDSIVGARLFRGMAARVWLLVTHLIVVGVARLGSIFLFYNY